jgi:hypothetical protein
MPYVVLERDGTNRVEDPSASDVLSLMATVERDVLQEGPPEFQLKFKDSAEDSMSRTSKLWFFLLFDAFDSPPRWLIACDLPEMRNFRYLADRVPSDAQFLQRTRCGVVERFRKECVLECNQTVRDAIEWFLNKGTPNPSLLWLDSDEVVRDV